MPDSQATQNLARWLQMHELDHSFPELSPCEPGNIYLRRDGGELNEIRDLITGSQRSMVVLPPGQGATTLMQELVFTSERASVRLPYLLVELPLADFNGDDIEQWLLERIMIGIHAKIAANYWDETLRGHRLQLLLQVFNATSTEYFVTLRQKLTQNGALTLADLGCQSVAVQQLLSLIATLHTQTNISVILLFDIGHRVDNEIFLDLVREIKALHEYDISNDFPIAALSETFFLSREQRQEMQTLWAIEYSVYEFSPYNEAEVFSILATRFRPKQRGIPQHLRIVLSDEFVAKVWQQDKPLQIMMSEMKQIILHAMERDWGHIPFRLVPVESTPEKNHAQ